MKRTALMMAVLALSLSVVEQATAGLLLQTHAAVGAFTLDGGAGFPPNFLPGERVRGEGNGALGTGFISDSADGHGTVPFYSGSAQAGTGTDAQHLLRAYSSAVGTGSGPFNPSGYAQSFAAWRDVAFVSSLTPPNTLRLNFQVEGVLATKKTAVADFYINNEASINITRTADPRLFFQPSHGTDINYPFDHPDASVSNGKFLVDTAWDSVSYGGTGFRGTFHLDTTYNPDLHGYGWGVGLYATSTAHGGTAMTNLFNTTSLESVTLTDGTPVGVTFDSGLRLGAAAPEPSSLALLGLGTTGLLVCRLRRNRRLAGTLEA